MKKMFIAIIVLVFSLMAFGCSLGTLPSNSFSLKTTISVYGGVKQEITFPTLKEYLQDLDTETTNSYLQKLESEINDKVYTSFYLKYWLKYMEEQNNEYIIGGKNVQFTKPKLSEDEKSISFSLNFVTRAAWDYYTKEDDDESDEDPSGDYQNIFLTHTQSKGAFPFTREIADQYLEVVVGVIQTYLPDFDVDGKNINFAYIYQTPYQKIKSNADIKGENSEGYYHAWAQSNKNIGSEKQIAIWINEANKGWWYLSVLGVTLVLGGIIFTTYYINKKKTKKR